MSDRSSHADTDGLSGDPAPLHRPSVELSRTASGKPSWRIRAYAADETSVALTNAKDLAVQLDRELAEGLA